jgi:hypothetical protein
MSTYNMLSFDELNELGVLRVVDMSTERDICHGYFSRNHLSFQRLKLFRLSHDVLDNE